MTRVAVTGHRGLDRATSELVARAIRAELRILSNAEPVVGVSCLADGADQIFAEAILDMGGHLEVVVPATRYRAGLPPEAHPRYDRLLSQASRVYRLDFEESDEHAHMAASVEMIRMVDRLLAVWDGKPARGHGGTADVVGYAKVQGIPVTVIWPDGAQRG